MRVGTFSMHRSSTVTGKKRSPGRARGLNPTEADAPEPGTRRPRHENSRRSTPAAAVVPYASPTLTLIRVISGSRPGVSLATAAHLTGVHPAMLLYYGRLGLLGPGHLDGESEATFDGDALEEVRRIEHYRRHLGVHRRALPLVCALQRESVRLRIELRFLHPESGALFWPDA